MKLKPTRKSMLVGSLTLLALITMAIPVWRFAKDNLRQTRVLPGGETATLISWTYGKKHPLTMHDPMSPLWSRALPPPVLSELTTEEDRLVAWFKIDFPLADRKKSFRATKFEVEAGDDAGQSVATVLHTSNSASVPRGNAVFTPFQIDAFPRSSKEIVIRFLSGANGLHADLRIANPVLHNYEIIAPSQLPAKACNGDLTVNLESLVSVKPQFIVDANGENRGEQMKDASGGLSNGYYVASGEERRVQPRFTCSWKDEHGWLGVAKRWRVTDDTGNFFGAGKASGSFLMPRLKENLKLEAWVSGPPVRVGFDGLIWDAGSVNIPEEMKIVSSKLNYSKQDAVIDRL